MSAHQYQGSWQAFEVQVKRDVRVPARDGIGLATDLYFPALHNGLAPGPFPVLVERTPYDKAATRFVLHARFFARHGYVAVTTLCAAMTALVAILLTTHITEPQPVGEQA